jgi:hypothetical protein
VLLPQLRRVRWAVRMTLVLGVAASVVANVLHALDNPISQAIAAWPPLALLLTVELISRVPVHRRSLAFARLFATATIAGIAAWVSYWHMAGVAARYGETGASPYLLPLSVDGLIVVASICLVELGGRISTLEAEAITERKQAAAAAGAAQSAALASRTVAAQTASPAGAGSTGAASEGAASAGGRELSVPATAGSPRESQLAVPGLIPVPTVKHAAPEGQPTAASRRATAAALAEAAAVLPRAGLPKTRGAEVSAFAATATRQPRVTARTKPPAVPKTTADPAARQAADPAGGPSPRVSARTSAAAKQNQKPRRTPAETFAAAMAIKAARPDVTETELAAELGISASRWRTIRREHTTGDDLRLAA